MKSSCRRTLERTALHRLPLGTKVVGQVANLFMTRMKIVGVHISVVAGGKILYIMDKGPWLTPNEFRPERATGCQAKSNKQR